MHVLVVEHDQGRVRAIQATLRAAGMRPEVATSAAAALTTLARPAAPDLILLEEHLPDMATLDFLQAVQGMGRAAPVVLLGAEARAADWVEATRLGVVDYLRADEGGAYQRTLVGRLRAAREREERARAAARLADALDSTSAAVVIADRAGAIEHVNEACARLLGRDAGSDAGGALADLFPLEAEPRIKGDLLAALHAGREWAGEVPVRTDGGERVPCLVTLSPIRTAAGRTDGLVLTLRDVSDRVAMEDALRAANRRLAEQASRDALTGLYNRGYFHEVLARELARALRYGHALSVVMLDLDHFKAINDAHGHAAGDEVLRQVARGLRPLLRDGDVLARYGGDEFCVLLPNTEAEAARAAAERLCASVAASRYGPGEGAEMRLSAGIATSGDMGEDEPSGVDAIVRLADRALYASKRAGGGGVTRWSPALGEPG